MFGRLGTDEGPVPRDQLVFRYTLTPVCGPTAPDLADSDETDAVCDAAGVGTAAVAVTLKSWRGK